MVREQIVEVLDQSFLPQLQRVIGDAVAMDILFALEEPRRFSEFDLKVSSKTLVSRLKLLERHALLTRTLHAEVPPRVVYERTQKGSELVAIINGMLSWERSWRSSNAA